LLGGGVVCLICAKITWQIFPWQNCKKFKNLKEKIIVKMRKWKTTLNGVRMLLNMMD
jgi:hypothetical protein